MEILLDIVHRLNASLNYNLLMREVLEKNYQLQNQILDFVKTDQLYNQGIRGDGSFIGEYSEMSRMLKTDPMLDHITLKETGSFYSTFAIRIDFNSFTIDANGDKYDPRTGERKDLFDIYDDSSGDLINLTEENRGRLTELLKPLIIQRLWELMK